MSSYKTYRDAYFCARKYSSDKWEHYFEIYDQLLSRYYGVAGTRYLEIGVQNGGSLEVMRLLLGREAQITGLDIDPQCAAIGLEESGVADEIYIGSQADAELLQILGREAGPFDVVLDDGSHQQSDMVTTFLQLFPVLKQGGVYIIEDTHTNHYPTHQQSFMGIGLYDYFKGLAERLTIDFMEPRLSLGRYKEPREQRAPMARVHDIGSEIFSIQFYDSLIAIQKKTRLEPLRLTR